MPCGGGASRAIPASSGAPSSISGAPHEVVGVLPASYEPPPAGVIEEPALYKPLGRAYEPARHSARHMRAIARLRPGVSLAEAQAEMDLVASGLERAFPDQNAGVGVRVAPLQEEVAHGARRTLVLLLAAVGLVLLLACANVAHMVLARSLVRRREMAIRRALGASGASLARLVLAEAAAHRAPGIGAGPGAGGLGDGRAGEPGRARAPRPRAHLARLAPRRVRRRRGGGDGGPRRAAPGPAGTGGGARGSARRRRAHRRRRARGRFNRLLIVGEVAAAFVLLSAAGLAVRSLERLQAVDPGFRPEGAVAVEMWLPGARYPEDAQHPRFFAALVDRVAGLPGVQSAGVVSNLALSGNFDRVGVEIEGRPAGPDKPDMERYVVSPGYFDAVGLRLLRGRLMTDRDTADTPGVAVVGESTARRDLAGRGRPRQAHPACRSAGSRSWVSSGTCGTTGWTCRRTFSSISRRRSTRRRA